MFSKYMRKLWSSPARKIGVSTAASQVILLAVIPILTRLFDLTVFAEYQVAFSLAIVLQILGTGGIEYLLPASHTRGSERRLLRRGCLWLLATLTVSLGVCGYLLLSDNLASARILFGGVLIGSTLGWINVDNARLIRSGHVRRLVVRNLIGATLGAALQVLSSTVGSLMMLALALVVGRLAGAAVSLLFDRGWQTEERTGRVEQGLDGNGPETGGLAWVGALFLANFSVQLPVLAATPFLSVQDAGQVAMAIRIVGAAGTLIGAGLLQAVVVRVSSLIRDGRTNEVDGAVRSITKRLSWVSLAFGAFISIAGYLLSPVILGPDWSPAALLVLILGVPFGLQLVARSIIPVFGIIGRSRSLLYVQLGRAILLVVAVSLICTATGIGEDEKLVLVGFVVSIVMLTFVTVLIALLSRFMRRFQEESTRAVSLER